MKNRLRTALSSLLLLASVTAASAGTARLQVIHNAADPAAASVDVYVNGELTLDDFAFRTATPFLNLPSGVDLAIGVAPGASDGPEDILATFNVTLARNRSYVAIANGVLSPGDFAANPEGLDIGFNLFPRGDVSENANWGLVKLLAFHGASDAPTVDIVREGQFGFAYTLFNDLSYGEYSETKTVLPREYTLKVTPGGDNSTVVAAFAADLRGLRNGAAVVFASGFLDPAANQDGPAFGLFAALPSGTVLELPRIDQTARLQVIHNAADPAAASVDVYVNGSLALNDFGFRTATPFLELPAGIELAIGVAPGTSNGPEDVLVSFPVTLAAGETYVAMANGVLLPGSFAANPNGLPIAFSLYPRGGIKERGLLSFIKVVAFHGATDAPAVDIHARSAWGDSELFADLSYGEFSGYKTLAPADYLLAVAPAGSSTPVATFAADLSGLGGGAAVVFASGFLSPAGNQNGPAFGLFAALPSGQVVAFPAVAPMARLQVIHNAADPAAASVDVYVNGSLALNDFGFRTATPFLELPAGVELAIGVAPGTSDGPEDILATFPVNLEAGKSYVAMANGVLDPAAFAANPQGLPIAFSLYPNGVSERARHGGVELLAFHGSTDAPAVDVRVRLGWGSWPIIPDLSYGEYSGRLNLPAWRYELLVTPAGQGNVVVAAYEADLRGLNGGAAVVFASGFLNPAANQNGAAFGLFAALPDGQVLALPAADDALFTENVAAETPAAPFGLGQNFPNPFNPRTTINFSLPQTADVSLRIFDLQGRLVKDVLNESRGAGQHSVSVDMSDRVSGIYLYRIQAGEHQETRRMTLVK